MGSVLKKKYADFVEMQEVVSLRRIMIGKKCVFIRYTLPILHLVVSDSGSAEMLSLKNLGDKFDFRFDPLSLENVKSETLSKP